MTRLRFRLTKRLLSAFYEQQRQIALRQRASYNIRACLAWYMKQRLVALLLVAVMVVSVVSAAGVATAAAPSKRLATPQLLVAPRNHAIIPVTQFLEFKWKTVRGASPYALEIQKATPGPKGQIVWKHADGGYYPVYNPNAPSLSVSMPTQVGSFRWHVTALSANPALNSAPTAWRYFTVIM